MEGPGEPLPSAPAVVAIAGEPGAIGPHGGRGRGHQWTSLTSRVRTPKPGCCPSLRQPLNLSTLVTPASAGVWQLENWLHSPDGETEAAPAGRGAHT